MLIDLVTRQLAWFDSHLGIKRPNPAETKPVAQSSSQ